MLSFGRPACLAAQPLVPLGTERRELTDLPAQLVQPLRLNLNVPEHYSRVDWMEELACHKTKSRVALRLPSNDWLREYLEIVAPEPDPRG